MSKFLALLIFLALFFGSSANVEQCGSFLTHRRGVISSPNFPNTFETPILCRWVIDASGWADHPGITVYLTQLFLRSGLKFTGYNSLDEYERVNVDSCSTRQVTMYDILYTTNYSSPTQYLEIELKLDRLEGNHLRVEDSLLDVIGFNITYEIGSTPKTTCHVVSCSFLGHCYASADFKDYECSCFDDYYGHDCSSGPLCNSSENPCKNDASCRLVGASTVFCEYSTSSEAPAEYSDSGNDPCSESCYENEQNKELACKYCESNRNCLMQCNYGHRKSVCDYPSHYVIDLENKAVNHSKNILSRASNLNDFSSETFKTFICSALKNLSVSAELVEIEYFNFRTAKVHFMAPREQGEVIKAPKMLMDVMGLSFINASVSEEPLLTLQNISISANQQIRSLGDDFNITCMAQGSKSLIFKWFKDNAPIREDSNYQINERVLLSQENYASTLFVHNTTLGTKGQYTCQVSDFNSFLKQRKSLEVFVMSQSKGRWELKREIVEKNGNITLPCSTDSCTFYFWKKNNAVFDMSHNEFWEDIFPTGSVLKSFRVQESVNYTCQMAGPTGMHAIEYQITVNSTRCTDDENWENMEKICYKDKLLNCGGGNSCALLNDCDEVSKVELGCEAETITYKIRIDAVVNMTNLIVSRDHDVSLDQFLSSFNFSVFKYFIENHTVIENLDTTLCNSTHFKVEFTVNEQDLNFSRVAVQESVRERKISTEIYTRITFSITDELILQDLISDGNKVVENAEFSLSCNARGRNGSVSFEWYKDGLLINTSLSRKMNSGESFHDTEHTAILVASQANKLSEGWYTCRVFNERTQFCKSTKISVISNPKIFIEPLSQTVEKEKNVSIRCRHMARCSNKESQRYEWMENGKPLNIKSNQSRGRYKIKNMADGGSLLELFNVQESAEYSCQLVYNQLKSLAESSYLCVINRDDLTCHDNGWPDTGIGCSVRKKCPAGYIGKYISRSCFNTSFSTPDGSLCVKSEIVELNETLSQLVLGYQNGSVESLLDSFYNILQRKSTYLPGEIPMLFHFLDDFWNYLKLDTLDVGLASTVKRSLDIISLLFHNVESTISIETLLSMGNMMHPWIFLSAKQPFPDYHFKITSPFVSAASKAIERSTNCRANIIMEISNGNWATPLISANFKMFPCDDSPLKQTNVSVIMFKNSSLYFPSTISQHLDDGHELLHQLESGIVSVASNLGIGRSLDEVELMLLWKVIPRDEWNVSCSLIQLGKNPLNTSVCRTEYQKPNLFKCYCSKLGTFTLIHTKNIFPESIYSNSILFAVKLCSILATSFVLLQVATVWLKKYTILFFMKVISCILILLYLMQVFFSSKLSTVGGYRALVNTLCLSCWQILIVSSLTSQLLVIYFKTCKLVNTRKNLILLALNGIPVLVMLSASYILILQAESSNSSSRTILLWFLFSFNVLYFSLSFCLYIKVKYQSSGKSSLMQREINSCAILLILMGAVEVLQIWTSSNFSRSFVVLLFQVSCFLLTFALLILYSSIASAEEFLGYFQSLCHFFPRVCFRNKKPAPNPNAIEEFLPLSDQRRKRLMKTGQRISQDKRLPG